MRQQGSWPEVVIFRLVERAVAVAARSHMVSLTPKGSPRRKPTAPEESSRNPAGWRQTFFFLFISAINGGLVGVTGPSINALGEATGLGHASLGRVVFFNRLSKLIGSFVWTAFASALQHGTAPCSTNALLASCGLVIAVIALLIATLRDSALILELGLATAGIAYGISDSAITLLTVWTHRQPTEQRTHVAMLNVGFTIGALVTPAVISAALNNGGSCYTGFYALTVFASIVALRLLCANLALTPPPPGRGTNHADGRNGSSDNSFNSASPSKDGPASPKKEGASTFIGASLGELNVPCGSSSSHRSNPRPLMMISSMAIVLFCVTGCEHAVATWLPSYGEHVDPNLSRGELALMSAGFWSMICLGRVLWALISAALTSGFPPLAFDGVLMLLSSTLIADFGRSSGGTMAFNRRSRHLVAFSPTATLWCGTLGLGFGCSSSLPCAITLPAEARVELTPMRLLVLNLSGSAGEMLLPYLIGLFFEGGQHWVLGTVLVGLNAVIVGCTAIAWRVAAGGKEEGATEEELERFNSSEDRDAEESAFIGVGSRRAEQAGRPSL